MSGAGVKMTETVAVPVVVPNSAWRREVEKRSGQKVTACYQCEKCTNGCPAAFAMDTVPHRLMRQLALGLESEVLAANTFWVCASCETCTTRCPNGIDIAHVMDTLRQLSLPGANPAAKNAAILNSEFLGSIRRHGRVHELEMVTGYTLKSEGIAGLLRQTGVGLGMLRKGKLKLLPSKLRGVKQVKGIFRRVVKG
ncbi:MAG: heterodisulfide reductase subunit C [Dehalococcoidia bacterium]|jgi:heterodisulfide reductase subunit C|nr:MAG: heterodisulfide reductase subunit C [Dehalococcoidia bacterium]